MSARDAESGSSTYKGGSGAAGGLGNGGIGGGMGGGGNYGGGYGGGAGRNGGMASGTGLTTGNNIYGNTAFGQAGGFARGYAMRDARSLRNAGMGPSMGSFSNFRTLNGAPMFGGALSGQAFNAPNANAAFGQAMAAYQAMNQPQPAPTPASAPVTQQPLPAIAPPPAPVPPAPPAPITQAMLPSFFNPPPTVPPETVPGYTPPNYYNALTAYKSAYGPEYAALAGAAAPGNGIGAWTRNTNYLNNATGYDPGYRADTNMTTNRGLQAGAGGLVSGGGFGGGGGRGW